MLMGLGFLIYYTLNTCRCAVDAGESRIPEERQVCECRVIMAELPTEAGGTQYNSSQKVY